VNEDAHVQALKRLKDEEQKVKGKGTGPEKTRTQSGMARGVKNIPFPDARNWESDEERPNGSPPED